MQFTAELIAGFLGGDVQGDKNASVNEFAKIEEGRPGAISFLANPKYEHHIYETHSTIVIVDRKFEPQSPVRATLIRVDDPYAAFAQLLRLYDQSRKRPEGISPRASVAEGASLGRDCYVGDFAVIEKGARLGDGCAVYPNTYVGENVSVGDRTVLYPGVKIYEQCVVGANVTIHAGAVIGADGFGFAPGPDGVYAKIPQLGNVVIEDNVEIGANTCIDRATMGSTLIRRGVKLDNLIQVGHNVVIGGDTVAAAQVGIAGSVKVGEGCMFGGQVGIAGHLTIGDNVKAASQSGISNDIPSDSAVMGSPAMPGIKFHRSNAIFRNLPDMSIRLTNLEKEIKELKK